MALKRETVIALGLVGLCLLIAWPFKRAADGWVQRNREFFAAHPTKKERIDEDHDPKRFDSLEDRQKGVAMELEEAAKKWHRERPPGEDDMTMWDEWEAFSTERISNLTTQQIESLAEWMLTEGHQFSTEVHDYRKAVFKVWASRDPEAIRARLMRAAKQNGYIGLEHREWRDPYLDELSDTFHFMRVGHAMNNPKAAWDEFVSDESNPDMKYLVNEMTISDIFTEYAKKSGDEALNLVLTSTNEDFVFRMWKGYVAGVSSARDWDQLVGKYLESLEARNIQPSNSVFDPVATRWFREDPMAAMEWYAHSAIWAGPQGDDPFAPAQPVPVLPPDEAAAALKMQFLDLVYRSREDREGALGVLDQLISNGESELATRFMNKKIATSFNASDIPLLEMIVKIPSTEPQNQLLLQAAHAIPTDTFYSVDDSSLCEQAVRDLERRLNPPAEIRNEVEAAFREAEANRQDQVQQQKTWEKATHQAK